jgi:hypothetical protein
VHTAVGLADFFAAPRDCSHSPIVFDLSFVPPAGFFQQAATSLVVGADVIDATRWAF